MAFGDGSQDGSIGSRNSGKFTDFPELVGAHLDDPPSGFLIGTKQGQRDPEQIIEVSAGGMGVFINYQTKP